MCCNRFERKSNRVDRLCFHGLNSYWKSKSSFWPFALREDSSSPSSLDKHVSNDLTSFIVSYVLKKRRRRFISNSKVGFVQHYMET